MATKQALMATADAIASHSLVVADVVELEQLVRSELRPQVEQLIERLLPEIVHEVVAQSVNGAGMVRERRRGVADATTTVAQGPNKVCGLCGRTEPDVRFDPGRRQCRTCRTRQQRERSKAKAAGEAESHSPAPAA